MIALILSSNYCHLLVNPIYSLLIYNLIIKTSSLILSLIFVIGFSSMIEILILIQITSYLSFKTNLKMLHHLDFMQIMDFVLIYIK